LHHLPQNHENIDMKGSVFLIPTISKEDADKTYPGYKTCDDVPSGQEYLRLVDMDKLKQ
jgi:hypothetical protein